MATNCQSSDSQLRPDATPGRAVCLPSGLTDAPDLSTPSPTPMRSGTGVSWVGPLTLAPSLHGTPVVARIGTRIAVIGDCEDTLVTAGVKNPGPRNLRACLVRDCTGRGH